MTSLAFAPLRNKRIVADIKWMQNNPVEGIFLGDIDQLLNFKAYFAGPIGSPYESGLFELDISVPTKYPYEPLNVLFITPVFHPNIDKGGQVCVNILKEDWTPGTRLSQVIEAMQRLLSEPNPDSPLNKRAARMMRTNMMMFNNTAATYTFHFAGGTRSIPEYEEKKSILTALNISKKRAVEDLSRVDWETSSVTSHLNI